MKAIMISIKPKWVAKILNGEKTIEIRKTMPKCDLPIDVYIYCTKSNNYKESLYEVWTKNTNKKSYDVDYYIPSNPDFILNGKVVAKFTLNKVEKITPQMWTPKIEHEILEKSCLKENELFDYVCSHDGTEDKPFYVFHIDNLVIFDKPKELSEFKITYCWKRFVRTGEHIDKNGIKVQDGYWTNKLIKAPQSWCYVEVLL